MDTKKKILNNKILVHRFISKDGTTTAIMIELDYIPDSMEKMDLVKKITASAQKIAGDTVELHFTGQPVIEAELGKMAIKDTLTMMPLMMLIIIIVLQVTLRSFALNTLSLVTLQLTTLITVGFFALTGESINMVTALAPSVIFAIGVADSIHLLAHYQDEYKIHGKNHMDALTSATKAVWIPCLFTSLTTAVGFFSFITATIRPVKAMGLFTALGVLIAFILTVTFLPALLTLFRKKFEKNVDDYAKTLRSNTISNPKKGMLLRIPVKIGEFSTTHVKPIVMVFVLLVILTAFGASKIKFNTNVTEFFDEKSTFMQDFKFIENNLGGYYNGDIVVKAKSAKYNFTHPESLKIIEDIQKTLEKESFISATFSIVDYFKEVNRAFNDNRPEYNIIPEHQTDVTDYYELGDSDDTGRLLSSDMLQARILYQSYGKTFEKIVEDMDKFETKLKNELGDNYSCDITGASMLWMKLNTNLKTTFTKSLIFAFVVIFGMMIYICKSLKLALISMVPNLFPICLTVGIMGWLAIPFNTLTVMIACVTLGISVDDTVHFITWFKRNIESGMDTKSSLLNTFKNVGKPLVMTSIILILGFLILIMGSYKPYNTFGILTSLTILFALIADFVFLPALILVLEPMLQSKETVEPTGDKITLS